MVACRKKSNLTHKKGFLVKTETFSGYPHRAEGLIALFDDVLQLSQHCDLCVLQLQLLGGGVSYASAIGGLCFDRLHRQTLLIHCFSVFISQFLPTIWLNKNFKSATDWQPAQDVPCLCPSVAGISSSNNTNSKETRRGWKMGGCI